ncbi:DUF5986 family protein [Clostridium botulinum]|uniref:DUF5986 family protein n=1 Tax=Clostridium botulinum TaxID=1491 RepID=UPI0019685B61|nr:DUF5986 family protein [Clostridium botulinum]MBN1057071.1 hypothetical protein [Clostridium botulinum]
MDGNIFTDKIDEELRRRIMFCIEKVFSDDIPRYLEEFDLDTKNGIPHQVFDLISGNMKKHLIKNKYLEILNFKRAGWDGRIIIDYTHKIVYSVMRSNRLNKIKKEKRKNPHYSQSIASVLNEEIIIENGQITFGDICQEYFNYDEYENDFNKIFNGKIKKEDAYKYCVVLFEEKNKELKDAKICLLDKHLDIADEISLYEYIKPDFDALLRDEIVKKNENNTIEENRKLIDFKPKSLNKIKKIKKKTDIPNK